LRRTDRREESNGKTLEEALLPTLFPLDRCPIVFPFLLGESKSESSAGSFQDIDQQMALIIEKSLLIQDRLRKATGSASEWIAGPLVWCFSHRGSNWRLSAGYMPDGKKDVNFVSVSCLTLK